MATGLAQAFNLAGMAIERDRAREEQERLRQAQEQKEQEARKFAQGQQTISGFPLMSGQPMPKFNRPQFGLGSSGSTIQGGLGVRAPEVQTAQQPEMGGMVSRGPQPLAEQFQTGGEFAGTQAAEGEKSRILRQGIQQLADYMNTEEFTAKDEDARERDIQGKMAVLLTNAGQDMKAIDQMKQFINSVEKVSQKGAELEKTGDETRLTEQFKSNLKAKESQLPDPDKAFGDEGTLRKEYNNLSKDFFKVQDAYGRVLGSSSQPSAAGDLSLIFQYMKMLDPGSTVREGEFANAAASGSFGERFKAAGSKLLKGERLSDAMRQDFLSQASNLYNAQLNSQNRITKRYTDIAKKRGLNPDNIIISEESAVIEPHLTGQTTQQRQPRQQQTTSFDDLWNSVD